MKSSTKNEAAGTAKNIAGKIKSATGKAIGNPRLEAEGNAGQVEGLVQKSSARSKKCWASESRPAGSF